MFVILLHADISLCLNNNGLLNGDDRFYFENALSIDYSNFYNWTTQVKNIGYYFINYLIINTAILEPELEIKLFNSMIFVLSIYLFLNSISKYNNISKFYFINYVSLLLTFTLFFVLSINYKDGLLFSVMLIAFSLCNYYNNLKYYYTKILLLLLLAFSLIVADTLRQGSIILFFITFFTVYLFLNIKRNISLSKLFFIMLIGFLLFSFLFDFLLDIYGRNLESYRSMFNYRTIKLTGIETIDIMIGGVFKSLFQMNPISVYNFLSFSNGIDGYDSLFFKVLYLINMLIWNFVLFFILLVKNIPLEYRLVVVFTLFYILIYSYIYGGLIGFRLAFIMYLIFTLLFAIKIFERKKIEEFIIYIYVNKR